MGSPGPASFKLGGLQDVCLSVSCIRLSTRPSAFLPILALCLSVHPLAAELVGVDAVGGLARPVLRVGGHGGLQAGMQLRLERELGTARAEAERARRREKTDRQTAASSFAAVDDVVPMDALGSAYHRLANNGRVGGAVSAATYPALGRPPPPANRLCSGETNCWCFFLCGTCSECFACWAPWAVAKSSARGAWLWLLLLALALG
jgi:hypothetical protein